MLTDEQVFSEQMATRRGLGVATQLAMTGDDWLSERDKKNQAKAEAKRRAAGIACSKKLEAAVDSLNEYLRSCNECQDGSGNHRTGHGDGRIVLISNMMEYASYLDGKYSK